MHDRMYSFGAIIGGVDRVEVECNAYLRLRREMRPQAWYRQTLREQDMMASVHSQLFIAQAGSMNTQGIAEVGRTPGFVLREPPVYAISKAACHHQHSRRKHRLYRAQA